MLYVDGVTFNYKKQALFANLNFKLAAGHVYGLLGKNGAGKSTLLNLLAANLFPQQGVIDVFGVASYKRDKQVLQEIFLVTEDSVNYALTIDEYLKAYAPFYPRFAYAKFWELVNKWQLRSGAKLTEFSHGEGKKFLIAFALATNCKLILLDEPTNGLDIPAKAVFRQLIAAQIHPDSTVIISSHQVRDLDGLLDALVVLDAGRVVFNQEMANIEEKLIFGSCKNLAEISNVIYSMPIPAGFAYIAKRDEFDEYGAKVDLETLFNLLMEKSEQVNQLFGA